MKRFQIRINLVVWIRGKTAAFVSVPDPVETLYVQPSYESGFTNISWSSPQQGNVTRYLVTYAFTPNASVYFNDSTNNAYYELELPDGHQFTITVIVEYFGHQSEPTSNMTIIGK